MSPELGARLERWRTLAWKVGLGAFFICVLGLWFYPVQVFQSYWFAWVAWTALGCGSLAMLLLQYLSGGAWGRAIQRPAEAAVLTLPLMALLLIPALFGLSEIFPWAADGWRWGKNGLMEEMAASRAAHAAEPRLEAVALRPADQSLAAGPAARIAANIPPADLPYTSGPHPSHAAHKRAYLTPGWFIVRSAIYLAALCLLGLLLRARSLQQTEPANRRFLATVSGPGLVIYVLCINFATADWIMSLEPQWYSTMLSVILMVSQFLSALALAIVVVTALAQAGQIDLSGKQLHDLGNLLLAFVVFWTYVSFSQYLIIWSGNLPREIAWYLPRREGGWQYLAIGLALFQFAVPFGLLLSRATKREQRRLGPIAALVLLTNVFHVYWLIAPTYQRSAFGLRIFDLIAFAGLGALWLNVYLWALQRRPLELPELPPEPSPAHD